LNYTLWAPPHIFIWRSTVFAAAVSTSLAGGDNYLPDCGFSSDNVGYFPTTPDFSFDLSNMNGYRLEISVTRLCDAAAGPTADTQWF
jgi:hypothetical protein